MKKRVSEENKGRRQNQNQDHVFHGISSTNVNSRSFLQNTFIIFSLGQEWHLAIKINFWLCNSHSASKHCHLSVDAFYFCISTNRIFLMLTKYFSLKKWQLKQKLCITVHLYRYLPTLYPGATSSRKLENLESFNRATDNILHIYDHLYRWYRTA